MPDGYEVVIGLEIHAELSTESKIWCGCSTRFGAEQNTHVCPICMGLPGALPVLNEKALECAIMAGLALNCEIAELSKFDRKNYFYPDLPKAYQISQYDLPVCEGGYVDLDLDGRSRRIGITRVHMEEEAGKSVHSGDSIYGSDYSLIDYNRTGIPLIEIVSEPDMRSAEEARVFLEQLKSILEYSGVSDVKMEEGSLRCDANISLRPRGQAEFGTKTEVKNINSFRAVQRALEFEAKRQAQLLDAGEKIRQETRHWNEPKGVTISMRSKEEAHDYRYFPDPDLVPIVIDRGWVDSIRERLPEMPAEKMARFMREFDLPEYDASVLTMSRSLATFFEGTVGRVDDPKTVSNWVMGEVLRLLKSEDKTIEEAPISPQGLADLIQLVDKGTVSNKVAKDVFETMFKTGRTPQEIVKDKGLEQISDEGELERIIDAVIAANPKPVQDFVDGEDKAVGFLVGQVMKATRGKANPQLANGLFRSKLRGK